MKKIFLLIIFILNLISCSSSPKNSSSTFVVGENSNLHVSNVDKKLQ